MIHEMTTLKDRLRQHFEEQVHDVDQEEIDNTIEVLENLEDDLSDLAQLQEIFDKYKKDLEILT